MYQRQLSKNGLASLVNQSAGNDSNLVSTEELRDLFTLRTDTMSDTYDSMYRTRGNGEGASPRDPSGGGGGLNREEDGQPAVVFREQMEDASEQDLQQWGWHSSTRTVPDAVTQAIGDEHVSFCFTCKVAVVVVVVVVGGVDGVVVAGCPLCLLGEQYCYGSQLTYDQC